MGDEDDSDNGNFDLLYQAGTILFLKRLKNRNKDVALAPSVWCDPKVKLDGAENRNEFWIGHFDMVLVKTENMVRSCKTAMLALIHKKQRVCGLQPLYITNILPQLLLAYCQCIVF